MANEFVAKNGLISQNNSTVSGSLTVTQGITGSLFGTASWANNATTASFLPVGTYNITSSWAVSASQAVSSSRAISASYAPTLPGGSNTQIQYNSSNTLAGDSAFTFNPSLQSLQQGSNTITSGSYSHAEGISTIAYGIGSHAEGNSIATGQLGYNSSISTGVITLDAVYGNVTSSFTFPYVILDDRKYNNNYNIQLFETSSITFDGTNTIINLTDTNVTTPQAVIGILDLPAPPGADYIIYGDGAHSEGSSTFALGTNSHAEGAASITLGEASHAGGVGTIAYRPRQTSIGKYSRIVNPNSAEYDNSFIVGKGTNFFLRDNIFEILPEVDRVYVSASTSQFVGNVIVTGSIDVQGPTGARLYFEDVMDRGLVLENPNNDVRQFIIKNTSGASDDELLLDRSLISFTDVANIKSANIDPGMSTKPSGVDSYVVIPNTDGSSRTIVTSVNNEYADASGSITITTVPTASYVTASNVVGTVTSASYALTASYVEGGLTYQQVQRLIAIGI